MPGDLEKAQLGLGHSYSRAKVKLKFNMVMQAIFLLNTINKDVNTFSMRVRLKVLFVSSIVTDCLENLRRYEPSNKRLFHRLKDCGWCIWVNTDGRTPAENVLRP